MKRISDEAFVVGYIPASGSCVPKRQAFKQPEVMTMLSYLWVLVNRKVKKQEKQVLALQGDWNVTSESGSYKLPENRHELCLASWYPLAAQSGTLHGSVTGAIEKRKPGSLDSSPPNPHFNDLLFRHLARPSRIPWKWVLNATSRRHMPTIFSWSIKNTLLIYPYTSICPWELQFTVYTTLRSLKVYVNRAASTTKVANNKPVST